MISLPPPEPSPKAPAPVLEEPQTPPEAAPPQEPPTAEEPEAADAACAIAAAATEADDAGAPDSSAAPEATEATSTDSPEAIDADAPPAKRRRNAYSAMEIAAQVAQVQEWLTMGKRPNQIRQLCADEWGLLSRAAESRMHEARKQMVVDVDVYVRKDKAAQMIQQLEQVLEQALQMRQGSNAIGALRLQADLLQLLSRHQ